jgi:hypothetical protein
MKLKILFDSTYHKSFGLQAVKYCMNSPLARGLMPALPYDWQGGSAPCKARQDEINYRCKMRALKKSEESVKIISHKFAAFGIEQTAS